MVETVALPTADESAFYETGYRNGWDAAVSLILIAIEQGKVVPNFSLIQFLDEMIEGPK